MLKRASTSAAAVEDPSAAAAIAAEFLDGVPHAELIMEDFPLGVVFPTIAKAVLFVLILTPEAASFPANFLFFSAGDSCPG